MLPGSGRVRLSANEVRQELSPDYEVIYGYEDALLLLDR
jgi:hypothetical protein